MITDESGTPLFLIAQQLRFGYELHAFESEGHFKSWAQAHPTRNLLAVTAARGRPVSHRPVDHRFDSDESRA